MRTRRRHPWLHAHALLLLVLVSLFVTGRADAQVLSVPAAKREQAALPTDPYGRATPEGTVRGFVDAIADEDYERAGLYLNLRDYRAAQKRRMGTALAQQLQTLLDRGGSFLPPAALSNAPTGRLDDGMPRELERVGSIRAGEREVDLLVEQVDEGASRVWLIAGETLRAVPGLSVSGQETLLDRWLPKPLVETDVWGAPVGHWLALITLTVAAYFIAWVLISIGLRADAWWCRRRQREVRSFLWTLAAPLRLLIATIIVTSAGPRIGASIIARELFGRLVDVVGWFVLAWLALRVIDAAGAIIIRRLEGRSNGQIVSIAAFIRRLVKALVIVVGIIAILDTLGYDMTAGIAALGVGGIALALGAQKVIENLVAGVSIVADQPVRVGDFCKVGTTAGTIEELGIRSTKIRTPDDTLVIIPNSDFAARQIENVSRRGKISFHPVLNLHYRTPPEKIRMLLDRLRVSLAEHPRLRHEPPRVRLLGIGNDRLPIEISGHVLTTDHDDFLAVQEEVTLQMLDLVAELGIGLAAPTTAIDDAGLFDGGADGRRPAMHHEHRGAEWRGPS